MSGGTTSGRVESSWPNLTNVGPSSSSISRRRRPRSEPAPVVVDRGVAPGEQVGQPVASRRSSRNRAGPRPGRSRERRPTLACCFAPRLRPSSTRQCSHARRSILPPRAATRDASRAGEPVLELGDAQLELLHSSLVTSPSSRKSAGERRAAPLADPLRVAAPAPGQVADQLRVPRRGACRRGGPARRRAPRPARPSAPRRRPPPARAAPPSRGAASAASGLGHGAWCAAAAAGARASTRRGAPSAGAGDRRGARPRGARRRRRRRRRGRAPTDLRGRRRARPADVRLVLAARVLRLALLEHRRAAARR